MVLGTDAISSCRRHIIQEARNEWRNSDYTRLLFFFLLFRKTVIDVDFDSTTKAITGSLALNRSCVISLFMMVVISRVHSWLNILLYHIYCYQRKLSILHSTLYYIDRTAHHAIQPWPFTLDLPPPTPTKRLYTPPAEIHLAIRAIWWFSAIASTSQDPL